MERLRLAALDHAGVAGRHRVDEDQVADREQRLRVVGQLVRRRQQVADVAHQHPARAEQAEVQPHAGAAGTAVERERHRPLLVVALDHVGRDRHLGLRLEAGERAVLVDLVAQHHAAGGRGVAQGPPADLELVLGDDEVVLRLGGLGHRLRVRLGVGLLAQSSRSCRLPPDHPSQRRRMVSRRRLQLSGGRAASASERSPVVEIRLPRGCRLWVVELRSHGEVRRGVRSDFRVRHDGGWPLRWSSSERQRASVETTPSRLRMGGGGNTQRRGGVRRGVAVCTRLAHGSGWSLRWSSSERQRASVETTR